MGKNLLLVNILCGILLLSGCTTYNDQVKEVRNNYVAGKYEVAQQLTAKEVASSGDSGTDALIWQLENATILRTAGKVPESNTAFEQARTLYTKNLDEAKVRILQGGAAMLTTPANLPYYGTGYDGILIDIDTVTLAGAVGVPVDFPVNDPARTHLGNLDNLEDIGRLKRARVEDYKYIQIWLDRKASCRERVYVLV